MPFSFFLSFFLKLHFQVIFGLSCVAFLAWSNAVNRWERAPVRTLNLKASSKRKTKKNTLWIYYEGGTSLLRLEKTRLVTLNLVLQLSVAQRSVWSLFLAQELNAYISTVLRKHWHSHALIHKNLFIACVCVCQRGGAKQTKGRECVRTQGGRSWLKFINFLPANGAQCAFFLLTNGTGRGVGGGCCLATAGRISDHVGPFVLSAPWETLHAMCCHLLVKKEKLNERKKHSSENASQSCLFYFCVLCVFFGFVRQIKVTLMTLQPKYGARFSVFYDWRKCNMSFFFFFLFFASSGCISACRDKDEWWQQKNKK